VVRKLFPPTADRQSKAPQNDPSSFHYLSALSLRQAGDRQAPGAHAPPSAPQDRQADRGEG